MNKGKTIFAQIMSLFNEYEFKKCVDRYKGDRHAIKSNCRDQFMVMSFAQFTDRAGLRDIETTLNLCGDLYRSGLKVMPRSTLAEAPLILSFFGTGNPMVQSILLNSPVERESRYGFLNIEAEFEESFLILSDIMITQNERLKEWAEKALSYYNEKAPEINLGFYFFQKPVDFSKECNVLIVGMNPGGSGTFGSQCENWGFQSRCMPMEVFTGGNPRRNEMNSWKIYKGLASIGLDKIVESDNCQYVNYIPFNSNNFQEYLTRDKSVGTYCQCVKLFKEYVEILQPRTILVLGTANGIDNIISPNYQEILISGRQRFLVKGNFKGIPTYAIPHPSRSYGWGTDAKAVMAEYLERIMAGEGDTLKFVKITSDNEISNTLKFSEITKMILKEEKPKGTYRIELNADLSLTITSNEKGYFGVRPADYAHKNEGEKEQLYLKYESVLEELDLKPFKKGGNLIWFGRCYFGKFGCLEDMNVFIKDLKQKVSGIN